MRVQLQVEGSTFLMDYQILECVLGVLQAVHLYFLFQGRDPVLEDILLQLLPDFYYFI